MRKHECKEMDKRLRTKDIRAEIKEEIHRSGYWELWASDPDCSVIFPITHCPFCGLELASIKEQP